MATTDGTVVTTDELMNEDSVVAALAEKVSKATLAKWRITAKGPRFIRVGRKILYRRSDLEQWLTSRTVTHTHEELPTPVTPSKRRQRKRAKAKSITAA